MGRRPHHHTERVAVSGWAGITVCVAWALLSEGIRVRPGVLRDVRDHVLFHLEPSTPLPQAEDRARHLVAGLVARARRRPSADPWPQDGSMPLSPRWRRALERSLSPLSRAVFRQHYGDRRDLATLEKTLQVDRIALEAARGGLREVIRRAASADGVPIDRWPNERLDQLLHRLAAFSPGPCPPLSEVIDGHHPDHVADCTRCDRAARLIHGGVLDPEDLIPPEHGAMPEGEVEVLALHFRDGGPTYRERLARELGGTTLPVGQDVLLVDAWDLDGVRRVLRLAAEVGLPPRDEIRGALLEGPGRWSAHGLLGPLCERAVEEVATRSWGRVDTMGELPEPLPPPPSARRWWTGAGVLGGLVVATAALAFQPTGDASDRGLDVEFSEGRGGVWVVFDVGELDSVTLVRDTGGALDVVLDSRGPADKASLAVGDGSYRVHAMGTGLLVVSSPEPLPDLDAMVEAASRQEDALSDLETRVLATRPGASVATWRR